MYFPTTRVLTVLELLQSHGWMSGTDLADRLEVDRRTVRRYITMLQDLGIPVESERGRHGGYRLRPGFKLPPLMFTEDEALAITLCLLAGRHSGLGIAAPAIEGTLAKVDRVLPVALRDRIRAVQHILDFSTAVPPPEPVSTDTTTVLALSVAAREQRRVRVRYRSSRSEDTERDIDPYGLVFHAGRWYLAGWCHLRSDIRVFRVDRIRHVEPLCEAFTPPQDFDAAMHVTRAIATAPWTWTVTVLLDTSLPEARQCVSPSLGLLEETPEGVLLRSGVDDLNWMARYLVWLGFPFVVREPPELVTALRDLAAEVSRTTEGGRPTA